MEEQTKKKKSFNGDRVLNIILLSILGFVVFVAVIVAPEAYKIGIIIIASFVGYIVVKITEKEKINCSIVTIFDIVLGVVCLYKVIEHGKGVTRTSMENMGTIFGTFLGFLAIIILLFILFEIIFSNIKINKEKLSKKLSTIIALFIALSIYFLFW